jgi:hypothetical protein
MFVLEPSIVWRLVFLGVALGVVVVVVGALVVVAELLQATARVVDAADLRRARASRSIGPDADEDLSPLRRVPAGHPGVADHARPAAADPATAAPDRPVTRVRGLAPREVRP